MGRERTHFATMAWLLVSRTRPPVIISSKMSPAFCWLKMMSSSHTFSKLLSRVSTYT